MVNKPAPNRTALEFFTSFPAVNLAGVSFHTASVGGGRRASVSHRVVERRLMRMPRVASALAPASRGALVRQLPSDWNCDFNFDRDAVLGVAEAKEGLRLAHGSIQKTSNKSRWRRSW